MEKLIELLNEYEPYIASDGEHRDNLWGYAYQGHSAVFPKELAESYIISARYGFIKWLVENDKIDRDGKEIEKSDYDITFTGALTIDNKSDLDIMVDTLLMLLSISDEPIRFLISVLK